MTKSVAGKVMRVGRARLISATSIWAFSYVRHYLARQEVDASTKCPIFY